MNSPISAQNDTPQPSGSNRSYFAWGVLLALALLLVGGVVLLVVLRDPLPKMTAADLEQATALWQSQGPSSYNLDLTLGGDSSGVIHVEVRDGRVTAMTRDGRTPRRQETWSVWAVPGQFETIERELELAENPQLQMQTSADTRLLLHAQFDQQYGYPKRFRRIVLGQGPEVSWEVTKFEAVP